MTPEELRSRLRTGEDGRTEFQGIRGDGSDEDQLAKDLIASADSGGGRLLLGVDDDSQVGGIADAKEAESLQSWVINIAKDVIRPPLRVSLRTFEADGRLAVCVDVPGHQAGRPFHGKSKYFVRLGFAESLGTEIPEMIRLITAAGFPEPEFRVAHGEFQLVVSTLGTGTSG